MVDQNPAVPVGVPATGATEDERLKGALAYVLSILTGIIVLIVAGDNKFLKFHAWQSIIFGIILWVVSYILAFACIGPLVGLIGWLYTLYGAYLVYTGKQFRIPVIAEFTENNLCK